jgi:hypothetical protein
MGGRANAPQRLELIHDPRRITMANKTKNATQPRPKTGNVGDRPQMVSLKSKKRKKTSRGK